MEELPEGYAEAWRLWLADDPSWPEARTAATRDERLASFLVDNIAREMMTAYGNGEIATIGAEGHGRFERARADLIVMREHSVPALVELMGVGNSQVDLLVSDILREVGRPAIPAVLEQPAREDREEARMRAAKLLGDLPHALDREPEVRTALERRLADDPVWIVRAKAAEALGKRGTRDRQTAHTRRALASALGDDDVGVSRSAALALERLDDPAAIPALINYLQRAIADADIVTLRVAQRALKSLSGEPDERDPAGWRAWWREARPAPRSASR